MIRDKSQYIVLHTPQPMPLRFSPGGFYRVVAKAECRACGAKKNICVRAPRFMRGRDGEPMIDARGRRISLPPPDPNAVQTVTALMLSANEHMVGCYDNPVSDLGFVSDRARPGRHIRLGKCGLYGHKTCVCGYVWSIHKRGCRNATIPRDARFVLADMTSDVGPRGRK